MSDNKIISFEEYLKRKQKKVTIGTDFLNILSEDIRKNPDLIEWMNFQNFFNKHKLFLSSLYKGNFRNKNPNAGYFISFNLEQTNEHVDKILEANEWLGRESLVIDAEKLTYRGIAGQLSELIPRDNEEAYEILKSTLHDTNLVVIVKHLSMSNTGSYSDKAELMRSLIKINDDAHFDGLLPSSDILFIDSASFLEKSWSLIEIYVNIFA